jgi:hypothetical protein
MRADVFRYLALMLICPSADRLHALICCHAAPHCLNIRRYCPPSLQRFISVRGSAQHIDDYFDISSAAFFIFTPDTDITGFQHFAEPAISPPAARLLLFDFRHERYSRYLRHFISFLISPPSLFTPTFLRAAIISPFRFSCAMPPALPLLPLPCRVTPSRRHFIFIEEITDDVTLRDTATPMIRRFSLFRLMR